MASLETEWLQLEIFPFVFGLQSNDYESQEIDSWTEFQKSVEEHTKLLDCELSTYKEQITKKLPRTAQESVLVRVARVFEKRVYALGRYHIFCNQIFNLDQVSFAAELIKDAQQTRKLNWYCNFLQASQSSESMEIDDPYDVQAAILKHTGVFKDFLNLLEIHDQEARFRATRELIRIGYEANGQGFGTILERLSQRIGLPITFTQEDMVLPHAHGRPFYVTTELNGYSITRTLMDGGSTLNVMPYSTFREAGIPSGWLVRNEQTITGVSGTVNIMGRVTIPLQVGEIISDTTFSVVDTNSGFHLLLGREWIHQHHGIPSTLHQCFKGKFQGREVVIRASQTPYSRDEMHLADAYLYEESAP